MTFVRLSRFKGNKCAIPEKTIPDTYDTETRRHVFFVDRGVNTGGRNLRDLVLLPCDTTEIGQLYSISIGIENEEGATVACLRVLENFGIKIRLAAADDCRSGDPGSLTAVVVFPANRNPKELDDYFCDFVEKQQAGWNLLRRGLDKQVAFTSQYSETKTQFHGYFISAKKYKSDHMQCIPLGEGVVRTERQTDTESHDDPVSFMFYLIDESSNSTLTRKLCEAYGEDITLNGMQVQVSCDEDFEALSMSFLDPSDVVIKLIITSDQEIDEIKTLGYLSAKQVDLRNHRTTKNIAGKRARITITCDLSQSELQILHHDTLREVIESELRARDCVRGTLELFVEYVESGDRKLYGQFGEHERFNLRSVGFFKSECVETWENKKIPNEKEKAEIAKICRESIHTDPLVVEEHIVDDNLKTAAMIIRTSAREFMYALYDNCPPKNFQDTIKGLARQKASDRDNWFNRNFFNSWTYGIATRSQFKLLGQGNKNSDKEFKKQSDARFGTTGLCWDYIEEKIQTDRFAFRGNLKLVDLVQDYIQTYKDQLERDLHLGQLSLVDVGPAVGALSTILIVRKNAFLWDNIERLNLVLIDVSPSVLNETKLNASKLASFNSKILKQLGLEDPDDLSRVVGFLERSECIVRDLGDSLQPIDLNNRASFVYSGFCHHHMNDAMRLNACRNMLSICKPDGFIGVVDESLTYKQYVQYRVGHLLDQTPVAIESYLDSVDRHTRLFGPDFHCIHKEHASKEIFYSFYGTKRISKKNSSTQPSSNDDSVEFQLDYSEMKTVIKQGSANAADFERVERIAEGGMGVVYKAFQKSLHRFVALKVLKPVKANEHAKQRFQFEAIAAAKLHHNNIVQVFALTEWESQPTIVMEYVDGPNLEQYARNKKLPVEEIVRLSLQISRAVEHAHENNIIHRDLKPMNILITREGVPKVADFGIAKAINANIATSRGIKGTWAYISPEMALQKECGPKADVYGIGGILYFLLTSQPPFRDEKFHELFLKLTNPNEKPIEPSKLSPRVPIDLEDICMGCLDKDADKRKSPGEVTAMLERCLHHA